MTTEWPGSSTRSASAKSFAPFGSSMVASRICTVPSGVSASVSPVPNAARAATTARWNVASRSTMACHCARSGYRLMNHDRASWTRPNAPAVWVSPPSGIWPEKKRGAATMNGNTTATCS